MQNEANLTTLVSLICGFKAENAEHLGREIIALEDGQLKYMTWGVPQVATT